MVTALESASIDYAEIARRALDPTQCALIVVDIQEKLLPPIFQKEDLVRNAKLLPTVNSVPPGGVTNTE